MIEAKGVIRVPKSKLGTGNAITEAKRKLLTSSQDLLLLNVTVKLTWTYYQQDKLVTEIDTNHDLKVTLTLEEI